MATVAVLATQELTSKVVEDLQKQARDFHIPEFTPPWTHQMHPAVEEAKKVAEEWALYHFRALAGSKRFTKIMESNICDVLTAGIYCTGPVWGVEFAMKYFLFLFILDDEVLHRANINSVKVASDSSDSRDKKSGSTAQIFLELLLVMMSTFPREKALEGALETILAIDETGSMSDSANYYSTTKRARIEAFLAQAVRDPGTVDFISDETVPEVTAITSAWRNLWRMATAVMPEDWNLRFAYMSQRDMVAMLKEAHEGHPPYVTANSLTEYTQQRRAYGFAESSMVVGELTEGIQISSAIYYGPPMQRLVEAANDIIIWHNDIHSFQKELLAGEVNLLHLISKREGCSYNKAAEILTGMVVDRCNDLSLAAAELRQRADFAENSPYPDSENAEKYIILLTNFVSATHDFHQRSSRFRTG